MAVSKQARARRSGNASAAPQAAVEVLEPRTLLNATLTSPLGSVTVLKDAAPTTIDLTAHFHDPVIVGPAVVLLTTQGDIPLTLFMTQTPQTATNFLNYATAGEYNGTVIHRAIPGYILQGGSYLPDQTQIPATAPAVPSEAGPSNTTGTIAAALTQAGPGSATTGWFINVANNSSVLDGTQNGGPFTAFGTVIYNGMQVVNQIVNLPKGQVGPNLVPNTGDPGPVLPLQNYAGGTIMPNNYVTVTAVQEVRDGLTFTATSDNPSLVVPSVSDGNLSLTYAAGQTGVATITVTATDLGPLTGTSLVGHTVTDTFKVAVGTVIGPGGAKQIRFTDADGTRTTLSLAGPGTASVQFNGSGVMPSAISRAGVMTVTGSGLSIASVDLTGTSAAATLNVAGVGGNNLVEIGSIATDGDLRAISAARGAVAGDITIGGSLGRMQLASATGGTIAINGTGGALTLQVANAAGEAVNSTEAIAAIQSTSWTASSDGTSPPLGAPAISRLSVARELNANLSAGSLGAVSAGSITASHWNVTGSITTLTAGSITGLTLAAGNIGRINDRGTAANVNIASASNITSVAALALTGSRIEAGGATPDANGIPTAFAGAGTITTVTVGRGGFSGSVVGAPSLGRLNLGAVASANGGTPFGLAVNSIVSLLAVVDGKRLSLKNASTADEVAAALSAAGITPNDLVIRIV